MSDITSAGVQISTPPRTATADREAGAPRVDAIYEDVPFDKAVAARVHDQIADLARWLKLDVAP